MQHEHGPVAESLILFLCALFLLASPFTRWWMQLAPAWWFPYLLWLGLIVATAMLARRWRRHDL